MIVLFNKQHFWNAPDWFPAREGSKTMRKILWLSRHELTNDQVEDLKKILGDRQINIEVENVTWDSSNDPQFDLLINKLKWLDLIDKSRLICGVFPPVAIEALVCPSGNPGLDKEISDVVLYSPVSQQDRKIREDGSATIEFKHLRWCRIH